MWRNNLDSVTKKSKWLRVLKILILIFIGRIFSIWLKGTYFNEGGSVAFVNDLLQKKSVPKSFKDDIPGTYFYAVNQCFQDFKFCQMRRFIFDFNIRHY